jgi:hypothetical protein
MVADYINVTCAPQVANSSTMKNYWDFIGKEKNVTV